MSWRPNSPDHYCSAALGRARTPTLHLLTLAGAFAMCGNTLIRHLAQRGFRGSKVLFVLLMITAFASTPTDAHAQVAAGSSPYMRTSAIHEALQQLDPPPALADSLANIAIGRSRVRSEELARVKMREANAPVAVIVNEYLTPDEFGVGAEWVDPRIGVGSNVEWAVHDAISTLVGGKFVSSQRPVNMLRARYAVAIRVVQRWGWTQELSSWEAKRVVRSVEASLAGGPALANPADTGQVSLGAHSAPGNFSPTAYNSSWSEFLRVICPIVSVQTGSTELRATSSQRSNLTRSGSGSRSGRNHEGPRFNSGREFFGTNSGHGGSGDGDGTGSTRSGERSGGQSGDAAHIEMRRTSDGKTQRRESWNESREQNASQPRGDDSDNGASDSSDASEARDGAEGRDSGDEH